MSFLKTTVIVKLLSSVVLSETIHFLMHPKLIFVLG